MSDGPGRIRLDSENDSQDSSGIPTPTVTTAPPGESLSQETDKKPASPAVDTTASSAVPSPLTAEQKAAGEKVFLF